jgi:hypothetical protein
MRVMGYHLFVLCIVKIVSSMVSKIILTGNVTSSVDSSDGFRQTELWRRVANRFPGETSCGGQ